MSGIREAALVLSDGTIFEGEAIGAEAEMAGGEVVFNTVLSGYQEVITDPSYAGQIITFTYPHIGNYASPSSTTRVAGRSAEVSSFETSLDAAATGAPPTTSTPSCETGECPASPASILGD